MKKITNILIGILLAAVVLLASPSAALAAPPENFQVQQVVGSGLNQPSGFEIAPDGRIFILQREGKIRIVKNGALLQQPFADLPSVAAGDRGLIGIAFDPEFDITNHYVYFYYTGLDLRNRLVRFDASNDVGQNPIIIYQTNSPSQELHVGGSIRFGPDGKMYFAVGDNGYPPNAQNLSNPHGKILRINKDGSIPVDNPFFGQPGVLPEIWAYGFRNPWRFQFDSATGNMYGGDVGDYTWEEVNRIVKGGNYGWPVAEGLCTGFCPYINPLYAYNHDGESSAVTGGPVYRGTMFPEEYQGDLFFGDYARGFIKTMNLDAAGNNLGVSDFDPNAGTIVDMKVASDGSLYYLNIFPGVLYRLSYSTDSHIPVANATADVTKGIEPLTVHFSSEGSMDPDEDPITYLWDFDDGNTSTEANPVHTFTQKGTYTVDLTVSDGTGSSHAVPIIVQVGTPPVVTIGSPVENDEYRAGDEISITSHAIDAAGLDLNDANIKTEVILHHDTHIHPFLGPLTGRAHTFKIPDHGEASANTWYEIKVTATDTNGLSDTKSVNIRPIKSQMTFTSNVPGLEILLDGSPHATPHVIDGVEKFVREISVPTVQELNGQMYVFDHWSDGGTARHKIITPENDTVFTAYFRPSTSFTAEYFNNQEMEGEPALVRQEDKINYIYENDAPAPGVNPDQFSVRWTKNEYFAGGRYKFVTATDDGVRLYIDGELKIDEWHGNNASFSTEVDLAPGLHEIKMEYFETFGLANASLEWDLAHDQPSELPHGPYHATYYNNTTLAGIPVLSREDDEIDFDFGNESPAPAVNVDNFSARWTRTETLPSGIYEFSATADDGVRVFVDGEVIIDKWIDQGPTTYVAEKALTQGEHTIVVEYYEKGGGSEIKAHYHKTADLPVVNGYTAEFFNNKTLSGTPVFSKVYQYMNFDWILGSPDPSITNDNFSGRFTKTENFAEGTYEFSVTADDGVRLYIDDQLVLDKWMDQSSNTYKVKRQLAAGNHEIKVEYYENGGDALLRFSYMLTDTTPVPPTDAFVGQYYNNKNLLEPVVVTKEYSEINFDWAGGSPDPLINANNFSARWTKNASLESGIYEFTVTADDGVRLLIDGVVVLDKWEDQSPTTYTVQQALAAGNHTLVVEYYENGGGAVAKMQYAKIQSQTTDYVGKFWNIPSSTGIPAVPTATPDHQQTFPEVSFDWRDQVPFDGVTGDFFVAQWTKEAEFEAGTYTFTTVSDDGIRVYVDDELVIDQWNDHSARTDTVQKMMTAGVHSIRIEYYEKWGNAVAKFSYDKVVAPPPLTNDFTARFWNIPNNTGVPQIPTSAPVVQRTDVDLNFNWDTQSPATDVNNDFFVAQWVKQATFEAGTYTFTTVSDDGIRVYVDDELVIDQWNDHGETEHKAQKVMTAGSHVIRVEYYEKWWAAVAKFSYQKGDGSTTTPSPSEQPAIASYVYNDGLENNWRDLSWGGVVDYLSTMMPFKNDKHIKWNPNEKYAGLYFYNDAGINTSGYKEVTFAVRATRANQKAEIIFIDDQNNTISQPVKLATFGGDPVEGSYKIYVIPLVDLGVSNKVIKGFHIKDISGEATNEIYVDSVGFVAK
jgi:glucose/arabinose dehydrogenase